MLRFIVVLVATTQLSTIALAQAKQKPDSGKGGNTYDRMLNSMQRERAAFDAYSTPPASPHYDRSWQPAQ
jgi:hypothetical protein